MMLSHLAIWNIGLREKSGGAYFILRRILRTAGRTGTLVKVVGGTNGPSIDGLNENVKFVRLRGKENVLTHLTRVAGVSPFIENNLNYSLKRAFQKYPPLENIAWWLFPHSFLAIHQFGRTVAMCLDLQHYTYPENFPWVIRQIRKTAELSLRKTEKIVCISRFTRNELLNHYPEYEEKTTVIYEPPDIDVGPVEVAEEERKIEKEFSFPFFIYPAVDWPHKNHAFLIKNTKLIKEKIGPEFRILLMGPRRRGNWLRQEIEKNYGGENIKDLGSISRPRLLAFYKKSRALLFPSLYEGFGLPLVEAMAMGTPIIASNCASIPEVVDNSAILIPPNCSEALIEAVSRIYKEDTLYSELSTASLERGKHFQTIDWWDSFIRALN
jgi:glycosyltransferase involved in cell wall biosynthesis